MGLHVRPTPAIPCIPRIFTTNLEPNARFHAESPFPQGANLEQQNGIERRHFVTEYFKASLFDAADDD